MSQPIRRPPVLLDAVLIALIAFCAWQLHSSRDLNAAIVAGYVLCMAMAMLGLLGIIAARRVVRRARAAAERMLANQKAVFGGPHEYRLASPENFQNLDVAFYDQAAARVAALGFKMLGDRENITLSQVYPHMRTFVRTMVGNDGFTMVAIYHVPRPPQSGKILKTVEFETELTDKTFITTSNAELANRAPPTPGVVARRYPGPTPPEELFRTHHEAVAAALAANPSLRPIPITTMADVIASQRRMQAIKSEHRQKSGYLTEADLARVQGRELTPAEKTIAAELERIKQSGRV